MFRLQTERDRIQIAADIINSESTYCYAHGFVDYGCSECPVTGFPDLSEYLSRARTLVDSVHMKGNHA